MKYGIVRRVDQLGRLVIPMEYRKTHNINIGDPVDMRVADNGDIVLRKVPQLNKCCYEILSCVCSENYQAIVFNFCPICGNSLEVL